MDSPNKLHSWDRSPAVRAGPASDLGFYVNFAPSAASARSPKPITTGILRQNDVAEYGYIGSRIRTGACDKMAACLSYPQRACMSGQDSSENWSAQQRKFPTIIRDGFSGGHQLPPPVWVLPVRFEELPAGVSRINIVIAMDWPGRYMLWYPGVDVAEHQQQLRAAQRLILTSAIDDDGFPFASSKKIRRHEHHSFLSPRQGWPNSGPASPDCRI